MPSGKENVHVDDLGRRADGAPIDHRFGGAAAAGDRIDKSASFCAGEGEAGGRRLCRVDLGVVGADAVAAGATVSSVAVPVSVVLLPAASVSVTLKVSVPSGSDERRCR